MVEQPRAAHQQAGRLAGGAAAAVWKKKKMVGVVVYSPPQRHDQLKGSLILKLDGCVIPDGFRAHLLIVYLW